MRTELDNAAELNKRAQLIKTASFTALFGNLILAAAKILVGISAGSFAVIGDGIDSSVDVLISVMTLIVARIISRPADDMHPWGHGKVETMATILLSCILFFAGAQLILNSAKEIIFGTEREVPSLPALLVTVFSIAGKLLLVWSQYFFGKKADSSMLKANAKNMAADVLLSVGVLAGLGLSMAFNVGIIDSWAAALVGLWVIKSALGIFIEANTELIDAGPDKSYYQLVFDAVNSVPEAGHPHRVRMRRIAGLFTVVIDIEVPPSKTVVEAHWISYNVEKAIKERLKNIYDIHIHIEPEGNLENEVFGLSDEDE